MPPLRSEICSVMDFCMADLNWASIAATSEGSPSKSRKSSTSSCLPESPLQPPGGSGVDWVPCG
eukprot:6210563-Pyramimonas_sp.AAC.1